MFAAILQQYTPIGIQQVVVIPLPDGTKRVLTRSGKNLRGVAGAWHKMEPACNNMAVGKPSVVQLTPSDYRDLQFQEVPTVLMQKLVRTVKDVNSVDTDYFSAQYNEVSDLASNNPIGLAKFLNANVPVAVSPVIQVVHEAPIQVPEPVHAGFAYYPNEQVVLPNKETEQEMNSYSSVVAPQHESDTILTVPDVQPYITRKFFGLDELEIYDKAREKQRNVLLTGDAGTGKTSSARNYAAQRNLPFVTIECTQQITESMTQGRFVPTGVGNSTKWKYSQLATAIQRPSVILINELTRMTPKAASLFLRLLEERELLIEPLNEVIKVHPDVLFIADQNTGLGYTGTTKQDAALVDRFADKLEFHYDTNIERKFIDSPALLTFAQSIREASEMNDEYSVPMSTRILKNFQAQARDLNFAFAVNSLLANFPKSDGEREAIQMRLDADSQQIADELGVLVGNYSSN